LEVLRALGRRAEVTVSLTDNTATRTTRDRLLAMGFAETRLAGRRPSPAMVLVKAANVEREADEIARRILEQNRAGRPFREIGIIVRSPEIYVPVLGATLERFGIPARFYFDGHLEEHAVTRYLVGAVEAMLGGWDHQATLAVLRLAPRLADSTAMDRFDFAVREQMPDRGLGPLKALLLPGEGREPSPGAGRIARLIDQLGELDEWQSFTLDPKDWAARFREMRRFFHPARPADGAGHEPALAWRGQAAVLDLFDEALGEAAAALAGARHIALAAFWSAVKSVLRLKPLRLDDRRRNLVHVLGAHEARQWELPVVFVCGLVERQFPRFHPQDPFFPDAARVRLNQAGIRVRTAAEFEMEERALFDLATSRATMLVTLSYPEFDARGDRNLPSLYLEDLTVPREDPRAVRPRPRGLDLPKPAVAIAAPALLDRLRAATAALGPTTLEQYRQCPFQFFGARTLRLQPAPARPHDRLDPMLQGAIVHRFLQEWWVEPQPVDPLFDRIFAELCEENRVPLGYRTARLRDSILDDLRAFAADSSWPRGQFQSSAEQSFQFPLDGSLEIRGKIDRIDAGPDGRAWVIDYKYSGAQATRDKLDNRNLLQAPLYFLAAEEFFGLRPAGMFYIGLRGGVKYAGWAEGDAPVAAEPLPENWTADARAAALSAVAGIRAGRIAPAPADPDRCRFCDYRDVCRVEMAAAAAAVEGA
jgi:ATP-dependent helicase/DNAse subunit B